MNFSVELPPARTGNVNEDIDSLYSYIEDLLDELEYLFSQINTD